MRGKVKTLLTIATDSGITPAHAGKRAELDKQKEPSEDHPRSCGEKLLWPYRTVDVLGSPPLMRGKVLFFII